MTVSEPAVQRELFPSRVAADAAVGWISARVVVLMAFVVARIIDSNGYFGDRGRLDEGLLVWDGTWYRAIAEDGFGQVGDGVRFAPLFAWLGHIVGFAAGGNDAVGLLIVANLAALGAGIVLASYGATAARPSAENSQASNRGQARMIGLAVGLSPASFVFVLAYAESLVVLAAGLAALAARRNQWLVAAAAGVVAGAARPTGMALSILLALLAYSAFRSSENANSNLRHLAAMALAVVAPVAGFTSHLLASQLLADSWKDPITIQSPLRGDFVNPLSRLVTGVVDLFGRDPFGDGLHLPFAVFAIVLVWLVWRELGMPEAVYSAAVVLVALSSENWNSLERYTINAFPVLVAMGLWLSRQGRRSYPIIALSSVVMGALMVMSWSGRYVP